MSCFHISAPSRHKRKKVFDPNLETHVLKACQIQLLFIQLMGWSLLKNGCKESSWNDIADQGNLRNSWNSGIIFLVLFLKLFELLSDVILSFFYLLMLTNNTQISELIKTHWRKQKKHTKSHGLDKEKLKISLKNT